MRFLRLIKIVQNYIFGFLTSLNSLGRILIVYILLLVGQKMLIAKLFEGCKLKAYQDIGGVWTIGWGHTSGVKPNDECSQEEADQWLEEDYQRAKAIVLW